jgi:hypothetical protein
MLEHIHCLFNEESLLLERLLKAPAPVYCKGDMIGHDIFWNIKDGVASACNAYTGQGIDRGYIWFQDVVKIQADDWVIPVCGTTTQVFEAIYRLYEPLDGPILFGGLKKQEDNTYRLIITAR